MSFIKKGNLKIIHMINSNHMQSAFAQFGSSGIAIISFMILARSLSLQGFGEWGLFLALVSFCDSVKSGFVATALIKYSSGSNSNERKSLLGSSWFLSFATILGVFIINYTVFSFSYFKSEAVILFLKYYPIYAIVSSPFFYFIWNCQIDINMRKLANIKVFNSFLFLIVCIVSLFNVFTLKDIVTYYIFSFSISSFICLLSGSTGVSFMKYLTKEKLLKLVLYGRFHMLAFLGSHLLNSSDTFLISAFLGPKALAIYLIPQRLWVLVVMPVSSAITVGFSEFSINHNNRKYKLLKENIEKYIGVLTLFYIPFAIILVVFSEPLVLIVGGEKYLGATTIFRIFLVYSVFIPFDQIVGVSLDAVDKPNKNFVKVLVMAVFNIVGDILVLYYYNDLELVAWVTLGTTLSGVLVGYFMLKKIVPIQINSAFKNGFGVIKSHFFKILKV